MKTKTFSSCLFALVLFLPLGAWADGESDSGGLSALPGTEDSCQATFSVIEQTLNIPCVEVNAEGKSVLYSAQLQQVAEESFVLTQVTEQPEVLESGCKAIYSLESGQLVVPCVTGRNLSAAGEAEVIVLYADVPASPSMFVVGEDVEIRGVRVAASCDAQSSDPKWRNYCTTRNLFYPTYGGQCTAYAWGRAYEKTGTSIQFTVTSGRDAKRWLDLVTGLSKGTQVRADSIAVWGGDSINNKGHVAYVERVENGNVYFTEANVDTYRGTNYGGGVDNGGREKSRTVSQFERRGRGVGRIVGYIYLTSPTTVTPPPTIGNVTLDKYNVTANDSMTVSWTSSNQHHYFFYLYNENSQVVNTANFLDTGCRSGSSNGSDGCLGQLNPSIAQSASWTVPPNLPVGRYKVKVAICNVAICNVSSQFAGALSSVFTVAKVNQTITFTPPASAIVGSGPLTLSASATSGLAVTFASTTPTICTVSGTMLTIVSAGSCTVTANQAGNASYNAATQVVRNITMIPNTGSVQVNILPAAAVSAGAMWQGNFTYGGGILGWDGWRSSGQTVTDAQDYPGNQDTAIEFNDIAGWTKPSTQYINIQVGSTVSISGTYTPIVIAKVNQTITFSPSASAIVGSGPLTLNASATSGLVVTFASTTPMVCTVSGTMLTIVNTGTCTVTADQAGNASYNAATQVVRNIAIMSTPTPAPIGTTLTQSGSWNSSGGQSQTSSANPRYQFTVGVAGTVTIDLTSTPDNYLYLLDSSGSVIATNDDTLGTNARIQSNLSAGTYTVVAATYNPGQIGSFTLSVVGNVSNLVAGSSPTPPTPTPPPIGTTLTQSGSWSSSGGRSETSSANPRYQFTVGVAGTVTIDLTSTPDNYLYLLNSSGGILATNDDTVGANARIQSNLSVGTYTVVAATYNPGQIGSFTLSVVGNVSNLVAGSSPTPTPTYRLLSSSTTTGGGTWGAILQLTASLSGRTLTLTASKADGSAFSSSGTMYFKVGSYETYGVDRSTASVVSGNTSASYSHDLSSYSWDTQEKSFYVRFESGISTGGYAWVGPITVTQQ